MIFKAFVLRVMFYCTEFKQLLNLYDLSKNTQKGLDRITIITLVCVIAVGLSNWGYTRDEEQYAHCLRMWTDTVTPFRHIYIAAAARAKYFLRQFSCSASK